MSVRSEYDDLMRALDKPTVGHPREEDELAELAHLIDKYPEETRRYLRAIRQT